MMSVFNLIYTGRVLNRFSKDIGFLDDLLPQVLLEFLQLFIRFLAILVIAVVGNPWLTIAVAVIVVVFVFFRWYYLKTARDVKRLEAIGTSCSVYVVVLYIVHQIWHNP